MPAASDPESLVAEIASGDRRALARLITIVEEDRPGSLPALRIAFERATPSHRIGVTGAPGAGKSTLTDGLITRVRSDGDRVAVLAVDPTSPFSGGAVLGDRVRMQDHVLDEGVYIRSMANRGHLGGLSVAAPKALAVLEAAGFPYLIVETVGVGQDEVEVAAAADTVVVVVTPGWGDGIQAAKAGILEIGDVFVVNKADRSGVREAVSDLQAMIGLGEHGAWEPPILETVASTGEGVEEVLTAVRGHLEHLGDAGLEERRRRRRRHDLETALGSELRRRAITLVDAGGPTVAQVESGELDPWTAAATLADTD